MSEAVLTVARRQLGEVGPAALSLRAIAREVGVVPSALYRYYSGRDAILTALIRTSYDRLGEAVETAEATLPRPALLDRWTSTWAAARRWAVTHPHEYALLYGTPVLGYAAPTETITPALRVVTLLARIAIDAIMAGATPAAPSVPTPPAVQTDIEAIRAQFPALGLGAATPDLDPIIPAVIESWTTLFGAISFEVFRHYRQSIDHPEEYLTHLAGTAAHRLGIR
ncbi:MAG: TetR/AcrR family transcriptional regulator [Propioniciclava sp.]